MEARDFKSLTEAYYQVYSEPEISEEAMIAAQYFYEQGLNEDGVEILIDELGLEEFNEWVYDIVESYDLMEAAKRGGRVGTRAQQKAETAARLAQQKKFGERSTLGGEARTAYKEASRGARVSERKAAAMERARKSQTPSQPSTSSAASAPSRKGHRLDPLARMILRGMERHHAATQKLSQSPVGRVASRINAAVTSPQFDSMAASTRSGLETLGRNLKKNIQDMRIKKEDLEYILDYLLNEGFANSYESAESIMENMSTDWAFEILDEAKYGTESGRHKLAMKIRKGEQIGRKNVPGKTGFKTVVKKAKESGARDPEAVAAAAMWKHLGK